MEPDLDTRDRGGGTDLTVRAYVRPSLLTAPVDGKIGTLEKLDTRGVVDEVTVDAWPGTVRLDGEQTFPGVIETFERFEEWADTAGRTVRPPFTVRTWTSEFTGETKRLLEPPIFCLAIERNGELASVVPHTDGDGHRSVADALAALDPGDGPVDNSAIAGGAADGRDDRNRRDGEPGTVTGRSGHRPEPDDGLLVGHD